MGKYKVEIEFENVKPKWQIYPWRLKAIFKAKINEIPVTGTISYLYKGSIREAKYILYTDNKELKRHPDYLHIRRLIIQAYQRYNRRYLTNG
jgi:hypothetical protein